MDISLDEECLSSSLTLQVEHRPSMEYCKADTLSRNPYRKESVVTTIQDAWPFGDLKEILFLTNINWTERM